MMKIDTMGKELAGAARASGVFADGKRIYQESGLLGVWYYRTKENGKHDENGAWCSKMIGTVRDNSMNHIVRIEGTDDMRCTGQTCSGRTTPCSHAVALIMHVEQDGAFEPMPNVTYDDMGTYMEGYTKEDELADRQANMQDFKDLPDPVFVKGKKVEQFKERPFDPQETREKCVQWRQKCFASLLRGNPGGIADLRASIKHSTEFNAVEFMCRYETKECSGPAEAAIELDVEMTFLQKGTYMYADTSIKRKNHIYLLVDMWGEAERRYVKWISRHALAELATYGKEWNDDLQRTLKTMMREEGVSTGAAPADERGVYGTSVLWLYSDILRATDAGRQVHDR